MRCAGKDTDARRRGRIRHGLDGRRDVRASHREGQRRGQRHRRQRAGCLHVHGYVRQGHEPAVSQRVHAQVRRQAVPGRERPGGHGDARLRDVPVQTGHSGGMG